MLDRILRNAGYKIGRYTSPHLLRYNERICINGNEVSDTELCESFDRIDRARGDISLTYFEFGKKKCKKKNVRIGVKYIQKVTDNLSFEVFFQHSPR